MVFTNLGRNIFSYTSKRYQKCMQPKTDEKKFAPSRPIV